MEGGVPMWVWAVRLGRVDLLRQWDKEGRLPSWESLAQAQWPGVDGPETPLVLEAASQSTPACLKWLIKKGGSIHIPGPSGRTALFVVRSRSVLRFLLKSGASPSVRDPSGLDAPGYWGIRTRRLEGFSERDHARLRPLWPADPEQPGDTPARLAVVGQWPHQVVRREMGRWPGGPSREQVAQALAMHILSPSHGDEPPHLSRRRLAHALNGSVHHSMIGEGGVPVGTWVALAAAACDLNRERSATHAWRTLVRWVLEQRGPQEMLGQALDACPVLLSGALRAVLQLRWSVWAQASRGQHAWGELRGNDRSAVERARAHWAQWGGRVFWRWPPNPTQGGLELQAEYRAWLDWRRQASTTAAAQVQVPGECWMATTWAWAASGHAPVATLRRWVARLSRRGAVFHWPRQERPAGWAECLASYPLASECRTILDRLMLEGEIPDASAPTGARSRL